MNKPLVFITGAAMGAVAALLLSPNSGERNREIMADKIDRYSAHGEQALQQAADAVRSKMGVSGAPVDADASDIRAKINEARDRIAEQITRSSSIPQDVAANVSDAIDAADEAAKKASAKAADVATDAADIASDAIES